jgi:RNA polymerase sigma-70 factor (ECF subfamily)
MAATAGVWFVSMEPEVPTEESLREEEFVSQLTTQQPAIQAFIASLMPGDPAVDDVLQATSLTLWRKRRDYRAGTNFRAWAFQCARWCVRAHFKDRGRKHWLVFDDELTEAIGDQLAARMPPRPDAARSALRSCLQRLRQHDRDLLLSHYEVGESLTECAERTGRSVNSLKVTLFRLRAAMRRCIVDRLAVESSRVP